MIPRNRTPTGSAPLAGFVAGRTGILTAAAATLFASRVFALAPASASSAAAPGASALSTGATTAVSSPTAARLGVLSIVVLAGDLKELGRDPLREEQCLPVEEIDALFPGIDRKHAQNGVVARQAAPALTRVRFGKRQVQVTATAAAQAVALRALHIPRRKT